jgi:hypothetical protein
MLVGISLFLCLDELLNFQFADMNKKLTKINKQHDISWTVFKVKRKANAKLVNIILLANKTYPKLCLVCHLLVYNKLSGSNLAFFSPRRILRSMVFKFYVIPINSSNTFGAYVWAFCSAQKEFILLEHTFSKKQDICLQFLEFLSATIPSFVVDIGTNH